MTQRIHEAGLTAGIRISPFTISADSALARAHPDWLAEANEEGLERLADEERILDVSNDEVLSRLRDLGRTISEAWGFDAVEIENAGIPFLTSAPADGRRTRAEIANMAFDAFLDGLGPGVHVTVDAAPWATPLQADAWRFRGG